MPLRPLRARALHLRAAAGLLACSGGLALLAGSGAGSATAAGTTANAAVTSSITLAGLTNAFTLTGPPGTTQTTSPPVTMKVTTNNLTGYTVTVQANAALMNATTLGNTDTIASSTLEVKGTGLTATFTPLSAVTPLTVHSQLTRSGPSGDVINNDYRMVMPFVTADTYSVGLTYIAAVR